MITVLNGGGQDESEGKENKIVVKKAFGELKIAPNKKTYKLTTVSKVICNGFN